MKRLVPHQNLPLQRVIFWRYFCTDGNDSKVAERHLGVWKKEAACQWGGVFLWACKRWGWFSEAVGENPSLLASSCYHLVSLPEIMMIHFLASLLHLCAHHLHPFPTVSSQAWRAVYLYAHFLSYGTVFYVTVPWCPYLCYWHSLLLLTTKKELWRAGMVLLKEKKL